MDAIFAMNPTDATEFLYHTSYRGQRPVMMWGPPGAGKSAAAAQLIRLLESKGKTATLVDIRASQYASVDFRGMPSVSEGGTVWNMPATLPFKGNHRFNPEMDVIALFLDEINSATKSVEAVMYQLVNDRRIGEHVLMDNVVIIAAGNRDGDKGVTTRMALPVCNRFVHIEVLPSVEQWTTEYAPSVGLDPKKVAYFRWRQENFDTFDPTNPNIGKAFATPRSVERAIRLDMDTETPEKVRRAQFAGCVGTAVATDYYAFLDLYTKVVPLSEILADPEGARMPPKSEIGLTYATVANVSGAMTPENANDLHKYIIRFDEEFVMLAWLTALRRDKSITSTNAFLDVSKRYADTFRMATS